MPHYYYDDEPEDDRDDDLDEDAPELNMDDRDDEDDPWHIYDRNDGAEGLVDRCIAHYATADGHGLYTVANTLWLVVCVLEGAADVVVEG
jgi:hypothetical protein